MFRSHGSHPASQAPFRTARQSDTVSLFRSNQSSIGSPSQINAQINEIPNATEEESIWKSEKVRLGIGLSVLGLLVALTIVGTSLGVSFGIKTNGTTTEKVFTLSTLVTTTTITTVTTTSSSTSATTSTTASIYACGNATLYIGFDLFGSDIVWNSVANYTMCCLWCRSYSGCVSYTYGLPGSTAPLTCFLKNAVPTPTTGANLVSASF